MAAEGWTEEGIKQASVTTARLLHGCNCNPEVTLIADKHGINHATLAHDDWCALLRKIEAPNN